MALDPPRNGPWHLWFAWHPVRTRQHGWRWLSTVERSQWIGGRSWRGWDYRPTPQQPQGDRMGRHTCKPDPIIGKCPCQMNIVEWCDWEPRARAEFCREKAEAKKASKRVKRTNRVELVHGYLTALGATNGITFDEARAIAERIDQTYYPEAWHEERNKETA